MPVNVAYCRHPVKGSKSDCQTVRNFGQKTLVYASAYEASNRGQWACALRAPPNPAPRVLSHEVGACASLNVHMPTAFGLAPLACQRGLTQVTRFGQGAHSTIFDSYSTPLSTQHSLLISYFGAGPRALILLGEQVFVRGDWTSVLHGARTVRYGTLIKVIYLANIQRLSYLVFCLILWSCQPGGGDFKSVQNLGSVGKNIISFGDSLTEGVGAGAGKSYPTLLSEGLGRPVINAGRRGDTTAAGLSRLNRDVLGRNPRLVLVLFGGNDFLRRIPLERTSHDLEMMVKRIQEQGSMVVLLGLKLGVFSDEYGPIYEDVAYKHGALLVPDVLAGILSDPRLKSDAIHPNGAGYELMTERILKKVKPLLQKADRRIRG